MTKSPKKVQEKQKIVILNLIQHPFQFIFLRREILTHGTMG
jgi:hypothetical protein